VSGSAVTVVLASHGYPATSRHGDVIHGLGRRATGNGLIDGVLVFHAGTALNDVASSSRPADASWP
jgi:phosphoribosylamine--glycine ligase